MKGFLNLMMKCWIITISLIGAVAYNSEARTFSVDSVGVEKIDGKTYIIHQVDPKETLFGISRKYNSPVNEIVQSNDNLKDGLKIGQRIRIPYIEKEAIPEGAKVHVVKPGETLFSIAQSYGVPLLELKAWNELVGNDLSIGQSLLIQGLEEKEKPVQEQKIEEIIDVADQNVAVTNEPVAITGTNAKSDPRAVMTKKGEAPPKPKNEKPKVEAAPAARPGQASSENSTLPTTSSTGNWISHKVGEGETLFSIAKKYDARVEDLIQWNGLSSNNLAIGQSLKVARESNANIPVTRLPAPENKNATTTAPKPNPGNSSSGGSSVSKSGNVATSTAFKNIKESGQAEVIEGTGNHKKYLALHRTAPVGTIMRIRNEENDVTVFARVVGILPNTGDNDKLLIKVSKAAFDQLRAVNSRFRVEVAY